MHTGRKAKMSLKVLELLAAFDNVNNREGTFAFFQTHVPWVAPEAYLNIVFKPASDEVLAGVIRRLRIPHVFVDFLAHQNGAILFSGALSVYGVHAPNQCLDRLDVFGRLPFNIEDENTRCDVGDSHRLLAVGSYGFDGSRVCIDRRDLSVSVFEKQNADAWPTLSTRWESLEDWVRSEITRISALFDPQGHLLVPERETLPRSRRIM